MASELLHTFLVGWHHALHALTWTAGVISLALMIAAWAYAVVIAFGIGTRPLRRRRTSRRAWRHHHTSGRVT